MEQRHQKRIAVGYRAEVVCGGKHYEGIIENLSATGLNVLINSPVPETDLRQNNTVELRFDLCPEQSASLSCRVVWSTKTLPHNLSTRLGLEIVDPSWDQYRCIL